ncbi:MAG: hypothetical protein HGA71_07015 [Azonexaceae bacterium]|nr:hypothetical protein [Azonexaceae bacterium]
MNKFLIFGVMACMAGASQAATWNVFQRAWNSSSVYFFDADTVQKQGDTVTIWVKYVRDSSLAPESDGSYATAYRALYNCGKRNSQVLSSSIYDAKGQFIRSFNRASEVEPVVPDTIGEEILKAICVKDFPNSKTDKDYFKVKNNDIFSHASGFFEYYKNQRVDQAPK